MNNSWPNCCLILLPYAWTTYDSSIQQFDKAVDVPLPFATACYMGKTNFLNILQWNSNTELELELDKDIYVIHCVRKKETKMFSVISPTILWQFWRNLAHSALNKFATTWCKHFPPHLNNVSTVTCETWNAHHAGATAALSQKETPESVSYTHLTLPTKRIV